MEKIDEIDHIPDAKDEELRVLKAMVHRLNIELSKFQNPEDPQNLESPLELPKIESCLNMKQLAPLVVAYEEEVKEKDEMLISYEKQVNHLSNQ